MAIYNIEYLNEMKTKAEYGERSFKKKYKFEPDKKGSRTGTITNKDGSKSRVDFEKSNKVESYKTKKTNDEEGLRGKDRYKDDRSTSADIEDPEGTIYLDKNFFKIKGSNKNERRDAILNHEIGHTKLHSTVQDSKTLNKNAKSEEAYNQSKYTRVKNTMGIDYGDDKQLKKYFGLSPEQAAETRKNITSGKEKDIYMKNLPSKKEQDERDEGLKTARKYLSNNTNPHLTTSEIEADRYAANQTSANAMKKGLRNSAKMATKSAEDTIRKTYKDMGLKVDDDAIKVAKKNYNIQMKDDIEHRSKALKDKDLQKNPSYK